MLGAIIGDICGSVYEFNNCKNEKMIKLFDKGCFPTDDTVMTVAVAKALMDSDGMEMDSVYEVLINSMHYYGNLFPKAGYGGNFRHWLKDYSRSPYNSYGNGSGMRVSACGWLYDTLEETKRYAALSAIPTHNHEEGVKGAEAIACAIFLARKGHSKEEIRDFINNNYYKLDFTLDEIRPTYGFDESCQGACPQAIEAFLEGEDFDDVIIKAISIGGDSDTIAAMAGAIAEAYYGIPKKTADKCFKVLQDVNDGTNVYKNSVIARAVFGFWEYLETRDLKRVRVE